MVAGLGGYNASGSNVFLLPVIAAVFLSTAVLDPGKFNPLGVLIAVYFLRSGVVGLQIIGLAEWVKPIFYGAALVVAVTTSTLLSNRRSSV
jgi:ribose transport system permease protein